MTIRLLYSTGDIKERRCEVTDKMMDALFKAISRHRPGGEGMRDALTMLRDATVTLTLTLTPTLALTLTLPLPFHRHRHRSPLTTHLSPSPKPKPKPKP